ncbi:MAG TPA: glycosyltransferase family 4 protein [Gemmatimonadaceae bacterium]|jgi:glycosyltransferase involved in cell wall biosynthesis
MTLSIAFFISDLTVGGAQIQTIALVRRLKANGHDVRLIVHHAHHAEGLVDADLLAITTFLGGFRMRNPLGWLRAWRAIRRHKPEFVVAVNTVPTIVAALGKTLGRFPGRLMSVFHTTAVVGGRENVEFKLFRLAVRAVNCLVYVSANQRRHWEARKLSPQRSAVILNGVDVTHFAREHVLMGNAEAKRALGLDADDYVVGISAALRPEKNHEQLVDAIVALRRAGVPATALIVGDGSQRSAITDRAHTLGVTSHVVLAGEQKDVRPFLAAMDVGVLCSTAVETLSLAALESMSMGVPMVLSDIGGASEIVTTGVNGYLFPVGQTDVLVARLLELGDRAVRIRMSGAAIETARSHFSAGRMVSAYEHLFDELQCGSVSS